jgi:hypothetical protein
MLEISIGIVLAFVWFHRTNKGNPYEKDDWDRIVEDILKDK